MALFVGVKVGSVPVPGTSTPGAVWRGDHATEADAADAAANHFRLTTDERVYIVPDGNFVAYTATETVSRTTAPAV